MSSPPSLSPPHLESIPTPLDHPAAEAAFWPLDPTVDFLNHGSFGSVPRPLSDAQRRYAELIESQPIEVLGRQCRERLMHVRRRLATYLGADAEGIGLVTNATEGVNAVLRSLDLRPGDVLLTTDHVYNAVLQSMRYVARRAGAEVRVVAIPTPVASPGEIVDQITAAIDGRTRLLLADHVTSPTAIVFPVERLAQVCRTNGVEFLCDGAHAPGMVDVDLRRIGATYYAGNLHKWTCAPKGCGFLWVDPSRRAAIHPATVSHFLDQGFDAEFDWQGTRDISAWLAIPDAIELWDTIGPARVRAHNHALACWAGRMLAARWGTRATVTPGRAATGDVGDSDGPGLGTLAGSMASVELPEAVRAGCATPEAFQADLFERERIEVPVMPWGGRWLCRVSCQLYNRAAQYQRLADAVARRANGPGLA